MNKNKLDKSVFNILNSSILIFMALLTLYPLWYVFMYSLSNPTAVDVGGLYLLPKGGIFFGTYTKVISSKFLLNSYKNTIFVVTVGTLMSIALTIMTSFALSNKKMKGNKFFMLLILFTMLFNGGLIPTFLTVRAVGLLDSLWALIIPGMIMVPCIIILVSFFREIPESLVESALIDGCSIPMILIRIIVPLSIPAIATVALFYAVYYWNDFFQCMLYITDSKKHILQLILRNLILQGDTTFLASSGTISTSDKFTQLITPQSIRMATVMVATLPIMLLYPFIQKYFIKGVTLGALKG